MYSIYHLLCNKQSSKCLLYINSYRPWNNLTREVFCYPHLADEKTEAQRGYITDNQEVAGPYAHPGSWAPESTLLINHCGSPANKWPQSWPSLPVPKVTSLVEISPIPLALLVATNGIHCSLLPTVACAPPLACCIVLELGIYVAESPSGLILNSELLPRGRDMSESECVRTRESTSVCGCECKHAETMAMQ